jgi:hypothetical protein
MAGQPAEFDKLDFPRDLWSQYPEEDSGDACDVVRTTWSLESDDVKVLAELLGPKALKSKEFRVGKGYHKRHVWA